ncbi:MAG: 2-phospho-L-lactate transferase [Anaerolineaceae bacterium]|nr:2-phospho-L-lactate transferase [Anaerolineaceae bacterium]
MRIDSLNGKKITAIAGGVGGARLARGMSAHLDSDQLTIIVNTGDDFEHLGLNISPDLDTVMYNLADLAQPEPGWGICGDSFDCMGAVEKLGGETWFRLGDRDLATHILRTQWTRQGLSLTEITRRLTENLGIKHTILPMSNDPCLTMIETKEGVLEFQQYFVQHHWQPVIQRLFWQGGDSAQTTPEVLQALDTCDMVVICPSNPFVSVDPILNLPGVRECILQKPTLAMSPIIGGRAVKGPAAKMFNEIEGVDASVEAVVDHYGELLDGIVIDEIDDDLVEGLHKHLSYVKAMPTLMLTLEKQIKIGEEFLQFAGEILSQKPVRKKK